MTIDTLPGYLNHWADTLGDKVWLRDLREDGSEDYTWNEARQQINSAAAALEARFGSGGRMIVLSRNRPHWFMADLAIITSGNVTVSMFTTLPEATAKYIAEFTEASVIFVGESPNWEKVRSVLPESVTIVALPGVEIDGEHLRWEDLVAEGEGKSVSHVCKPDDMMSLVFTSGTTGMPKGVIQTHSTNIVPINRFQVAFSLRQQPRYFSYLPLSHIAERQIVEFASLITGGEVFFNEALDTILRDLQRAKPHMFFGPPRIWEQFQQAILAKFGGAEALDAALEQDAEGIGNRRRGLASLLGRSHGLVRPGGVGQLCHC